VDKGNADEKEEDLNRAAEWGVAKVCVVGGRYTCLVHGKEGSETTAYGNHYVNRTGLNELEGGWVYIGKSLVQEASYNYFPSLLVRYYLLI
jgi:hypothetical protein